MSGRMWTAVLAMMAAVNLTLAQDVVYHHPKMSCTSEGYFGHCTVSDVGNLRVRWTLYTTPQYKAEGGESFIFESPHEWTAIEAAVTDSYHDTIRLRMEVCRVHNRAKFRLYQGS